MLILFIRQTRDKATTKLYSVSWKNDVIYYDKILFFFQTEKWKISAVRARLGSRRVCRVRRDPSMETAVDWWAKFSLVWGWDWDWSCSLQFQVPEKRARFERTADMLAKSGLLDITMKTAELIRSNQQAKNDLMKLKVEIDEFVQKVLSNPENQVNHHWRWKWIALRQQFNFLIFSKNISTWPGASFYQILFTWNKFPHRRRFQ